MRGRGDGEEEGVTYVRGCIDYATAFLPEGTMVGPFV